MGNWAVAEAKAKFNEVVEQAQKKGPQQITKAAIAGGLSGERLFAAG